MSEIPQQAFRLKKCLFRGLFQKSKTNEQISEQNISIDGHWKKYTKEEQANKFNSNANVFYLKLVTPIAQ